MAKNNIFTKIYRFFKTSSCQKETDCVEACVSVEEEYEKCIICGVTTNIPISMPIDWRENYEIGLGQICAECAKKQREDAVVYYISNNR